MNEEVLTAVANLTWDVPSGWLSATCKALRGLPPTASADFVLQRLPETQNIELQIAIESLIRTSPQLMSWEALSWTLESSAALHRRWQMTLAQTDKRYVELDC